MITRNVVLTPQKFLEEMVKKIYYFGSSIDDDAEFIENVLNEKFGKRKWYWPLSEVEEPLRQGKDIVLVECLVYFDEVEAYQKQYFWFDTNKNE